MSSAGIFFRPYILGECGTRINTFNNVSPSAAKPGAKTMTAAEGTVNLFGQLSKTSGYHHIWYLVLHVDSPYQGTKAMKPRRELRLGNRERRRGPG